MQMFHIHMYIHCIDEVEQFTPIVLCICSITCTNLYCYVLLCIVNVIHLYCYVLAKVEYLKCCYVLAKVVY